MNSFHGDKRHSIKLWLNKIKQNNTGSVQYDILCNFFNVWKDFKKIVISAMYKCAIHKIMSVNAENNCLAPTTCSVKIVTLNHKFYGNYTKRRIELWELNGIMHWFNTASNMSILLVQRRRNSISELYIHDGNQLYFATINMYSKRWHWNGWKFKLTGQTRPNKHVILIRFLIGM
jgi:hypothetical protein